MEDRNGFNPEWLAYLKRLDTTTFTDTKTRLSYMHGRLVRIEVWPTENSGIDIWLTNDRPSPYGED